MAISFELPERIKQNLQMLEGLARGVMRPESRDLDEHEHKRPTTFIQMTWPVAKEQQRRDLEKAHAKARGEVSERKGPSITYLNMIHTF